MLDTAIGGLWDTVYDHNIGHEWSISGSGYKGDPSRVVTDAKGAGGHDMLDFLVSVEVDDVLGEYSQ